MQGVRHDPSSDVAHQKASSSQQPPLPKRPRSKSDAYATCPKKSSTSSVLCDDQLQPSGVKKVTKSPRPPSAIILPSPVETAANTYESVLPSPTSNTNEKSTKSPRTNSGGQRISIPSSESGDSPRALPPTPQPAVETVMDELYECPDTKPLPQSDKLYECLDKVSLQANVCYQVLSPDPGCDNIAMQPNVVYDMSTTSDQPQECDTIN